MWELLSLLVWAARLCINLGGFWARLSVGVLPELEGSQQVLPSLFLGWGEILLERIFWVSDALWRTAWKGRGLLAGNLQDGGVKRYPIYQCA